MDHQTAKRISAYAEDYCIGASIGSVKLGGEHHYSVHFMDDDLLFSNPLGAIKFVEAIAEERNLKRRTVHLNIAHAV